MKRLRQALANLAVGYQLNKTSLWRKARTLFMITVVISGVGFLGVKGWHWMRGSTPVQPPAVTKSPQPVPQATGVQVQPIVPPKLAVDGNIAPTPNAPGKVVAISKQKAPAVRKKKRKKLRQRQRELEWWEW